MLVRAVHAVAIVAELALHLRVKIHALFAVCALREKFALLRRVVECTLPCSLLALREVLAPNLFGVRGIVRLRVTLHTLDLRRFPLHLRNRVLLWRSARRRDHV